ncbi:LytTR family DNA-binding domain-containing protein [Dyadobacter sp. CY107]|uniref:LytR/AlgR family response regulator transcription factor n=1 Tax=Dyadobacter fanqingshengii TaxID=2906443 RepID=UPI001F34038C|nr:LytTR family DNA-binding domain-containing protein [Dyadobacter fanqingshengii]MCF2505186.1 LytTR family DNA-binding domain-containing protein [Dyadobacter fanqingshengii]
MDVRELSVRIAIIDDEFFVRQTLISMLSGIPNARVIGEAEDVASGIELIMEKEPDLILLDIKMPARSGFDLLEELTHRQQSYGLIFISGYPDEALTAVQKAAPYFHSDFVVKPIDPAILKAKFSIFYNKWQAAKEQESELASLLEAGIPQTYKADQLVFQNSQLFHCINMDDILYCESANRQINVYCSQFEHINIPNTTLDAIEKMLPADQFLRIGKSHILNKAAIRFIQKGNRPKCILARNGKCYEVQLYASNIEKVEQSYSSETK